MSGNQITTGTGHFGRMEPVLCGGESGNVSPCCTFASLSGTARVGWRCKCCGLRERRNPFRNLSGTQPSCRNTVLHLVNSFPVNQVLKISRSVWGRGSACRNLSTCWLTALSHVQGWEYRRTRGTGAVAALSAARCLPGEMRASLPRLLRRTEIS